MLVVFFTPRNINMGQGQKAHKIKRQYGLVARSNLPNFIEKLKLEEVHLFNGLS